MPASRPSRGPRSALSGATLDLTWFAVALVLVAVAFLVGAALNVRGVPLHAPNAAPLLAAWQPRVAPTTPAAVAIAVLVVGWGPAIAHRLGWRWLLLAAYVTSASWVFALGLVDGWSRLATRLASHGEYLTEVADAPPPLQLLSTYAGRIIHGQPDSWATHVAGHPPGALEFFVLLDRVGLGGGGWAAAVCMLAGSSACVAVAIALHSLAGEQMARSAAPYLVVVPAALWIGVSADAFFLAVSAWGIALLAVATHASGVRGDLAAVGSGLLFGYTVYLSYGLVLVAAIAGAVLLAGRRVRPGLVALAAVAAVVVAVTAAGFWWWDGYQHLVIRYHQGVGGERPYAYWVWANVAALVLCTGPAMAAGLRRTGVQAVTAARTRCRTPGWGLAAVVLGAALALAVATISGLSKGEVARIWLPFALWLVPACALLPRPRLWLAVQVTTALLLQHLLLINW